LQNQNPKASNTSHQVIQPSYGHTNLVELLNQQLNHKPNHQNKTHFLFGEDLPSKSLNFKPPIFCGDFPVKYLWRSAYNSPLSAISLIRAACRSEANASSKMVVSDGYFVPIIFP